MKLRLLFASSLFAVTVGMVPHAASAQGVTIDQDGVHVMPQNDRGYDRYNQYDRGQQYERGQYDRGVGPREARRIARGAGLADVFNVSQRGNVWIVRGTDFRGRDMRVTVSARTGEVVDVRRFRS
ncbi:hypothetical protein K32_39300 [Kaistia sp. 32K]|uniref:hypothetical protein n=1 Tax=Kaistia sp. 32K TaxID=2795690 RepID=UPI0019162E22|nr:hypothetical protein [Kaistia sp. 32K]BCP55313.1 hypothetical protein K32_39300 [Kaistia sp. 32K]